MTKRMIKSLQKKRREERKSNQENDEVVDDFLLLDAESLIEKYQLDNVDDLF